MVKNGADHPLNVALEANKGMMIPTLTPEALDTIEVDRVMNASRYDIRQFIKSQQAELRRLRTENEEQRRRLGSALSIFDRFVVTKPMTNGQVALRAALTGGG